VGVVFKIRCPVCGGLRSPVAFRDTHALRVSRNDIGSGKCSWDHNVAISREDALMVRQQIAAVLVELDAALAQKS